MRRYNDVTGTTSYLFMRLINEAEGGEIILVIKL
jgi:hypothetical protein